MEIDSYINKLMMVYLNVKNYDKKYYVNEQQHT